MALTAKEKAIYEQLKKLPYRLPPRPVQPVAKELGIPTQELRNLLEKLLKEGLMTPDLDRRIMIQKTLDEKYLNVTEMVAAPLLTANEIRERRMFPGREPRHFSAVTLPREFAGNALRFCSFVIPDNAMGPLQMWERQVAVCAMGLIPRQGAPVLCILPVSQTVCIRCCYQRDNRMYELSDPERTQVVFFDDAYYPDHVIGPIVAVQRFCDTFLKAGEFMVEKPEK